jgi:hypothetical protein
MTPRTLLPLLAVAAGALAVPTGASAAADCPLNGPREAVEHPIGATGLVARDPYGGLLPRNRLFYDFSVRGPAAALATVAKVQWALDGTVVREDPRAPFEWKGPSDSSRRMPAGDHTITVTVVPQSGEPASTSFALTATDCQQATFWAELPRRSGPASLDWDAAFESADGEPLTGVAAVATKNVRVGLPARLRNRKIGTLRITGSGGRQTRTYTLRGRGVALSKGRLRVRFVPGDRSFLNIGGLPAGTHAVSVKLVPGVASVRSPTRSFLVGGTLIAASGSVSLTTGGMYV